MSDSKINDGGSAFPIRQVDGVHPTEPGMSVRDWLAGQVEVPDDLGWVASALMGEEPPKWTSEGDYEQSLVCAKWWAEARARYRLMDADAMIAARTVGLTSAEARYTKCCVCGRCVDTREEDEGGDEHGAEVSPGLWVCSPECDSPYIPRDNPCLP